MKHYCPYISPAKRMRWEFMQENMPEELEELYRQGPKAMDAYMNEMLARYAKVQADYIINWDKTHEHLKKPGDWNEFLRGHAMAEQVADEIARREVIEAY